MVEALARHKIPDSDLAILERVASENLELLQLLATNGNGKTHIK